MIQAKAVCVKIAVLIFIFASIAGPQVATAQSRGCSEDHKVYARLNGPLFYSGHRGDYSDLERYRGAKQKGTIALTEFLNERIIKELNSGADAEALASYLSCIQEDTDSSFQHHRMNLRSFDPDTTNTPQVLTGRTLVPVVVTALAVARGGSALPDTKAVVGCFAKNGTNWQWIADAGKDFEGQTLFVYPLKSPVNSEIWFLISGRHFGDTGGNLLAEVWGCDGRKLEMKWRRADLRWGVATVQADGSLVTLTYESASADRISHLNKRTEVLRVSPKGLE